MISKCLDAISQYLQFKHFSFNRALVLQNLDTLNKQLVGEVKRHTITAL